MVAFGALLAAAGAGITNGFSAILLPQLESNSTTIRITELESTWIASMAPLPMAIGCIAGGVLMEKFGRKLAHLILSVPFIIGWILISVADTLTFLLIGRFITGFCVGLLGPIGAVYIGETCAPRYRGILLGAISFAVSLGILIVHVAGTFLHWQQTATICAVFPLLCFSIMIVVPESPAWLLAHGDLVKAREAFVWLRGSGVEATEELTDLIEKQARSKTQSASYSWRNLHVEVQKRTFLRPLAVILVFFFVMQFSGVNIVIFYSVSIMRDTLGRDGINGYTATILIDFVRLIMSVLACVLLRKVGRRPLALFSAVGTALSLFGLAAYLYVARMGTAQIVWLPLLFLCLYICFISLGVVPLPWCMTGELFPLAIRGLGSGASAAFNFIVFFVVIQTGPGMFSTVGPEGAFLIYGIIAFFGAIFFYFFLPETKNRTLQQIEDGFKVPTTASVE